MKKRVKLKGRLKIYMQISMYLGLLLLLVDIGIYFLDMRAGFLITCFLVFYFAMILYLMLYNRPIIINELVSFATQYGQIQKELLRELSIPYALLDEDGKIVWNNNAFARAIQLSLIHILKEGMTIGEVWGKCGFSDYSSFLRNFRKEYGMSPTSYRAYLEKK